MSPFAKKNWSPEDLIASVNERLEDEIRLNRALTEKLSDRIEDLAHAKMIRNKLERQNDDLNNRIYDLESRLEDAEFLHEQALQDAQEWQEKAEKAAEVVNSAGKLIINDKNQTRVFIENEEIILNEGDSLKFNYTVELT